MPPEDSELSATCRGVGKHVYVFVSDDVWEVNVFKQDIEKIIHTFDCSTPATSINSKKGIYEILTETFGNPPDVDNDHRIYFLITQLGEYRGHDFDGYFRFIDEIAGKHSNHMEILYLDSDDPSDDYHLGVIAHEFQHLIHWQYDPKETKWLSESLSEVAMILCGYYTDEKKVIRYLNNTNSSLISRHHMVDYGACLLWGTYIYERLGIAFLGNLVREKAGGIKGFQNTLDSMHIVDNFSTVFGDWLVANYLHNKIGNNKKYRYQSISLPITPAVKHFLSLPVSETGEVAGYAVDYLKFTIERVKNKKLRISFESESPDDFLIKVIKLYNDHVSDPLVEDVKLSKPIEAFDVKNLGMGCREVVLVVSVLKPTNKPVSYSYSASLMANSETKLNQD
ncbi:Zn-dependent hydrolase, including glyoxylase [Candidatus Scalindua japonica]|uniref:Zn-dependent hydrolase, including glyoxylase n=2 Tax=Candidatus Scalindua japonica TaxID=1284222 RepID=A0A286U3L6_9BACT|nr:Zn-dependent hydrolase, including glyoxylase [Candidatus Scalindua japonica]